MAKTAISPGTERAFILGLNNAKPQYPYIPGYCCAGYVLKTGKNITRFKEGDRVACYAIEMGHREIGNVKDHNLVPVPSDISFRVAAFTSLGQTSLQAIRKAQLEIGESVAVLGLGIVGQLALQFSRINGALPIIGIDLVNEKLETALNCGADYIINSGKEDLNRKLKELLNGSGPNVIIESTGSPAAITTACEAIGRNGRIILLGCTRGISKVDFYRDINKKTTTILGAHAVDGIPMDNSYPHYWTYIDDAECFLNLIQKKRMDIESLIQHEIGIKEIEDTYKKLLSWEKSLLTVLINWIDE